MYQHSPSSEIVVTRRVGAPHRLMLALLKQRFFPRFCELSTHGQYISVLETCNRTFGPQIRVLLVVVVRVRTLYNHMCLGPRTKSREMSSRPNSRLKGNITHDTLSLSATTPSSADGSQRNKHNGFRSPQASGFNPGRSSPSTQS